MIRKCEVFSNELYQDDCRNVACTGAAVAVGFEFSIFCHHLRNTDLKSLRALNITTENNMVLVNKETCK